MIYESIWSRYLGLFVGHGAYAQILVLVIFLGGMSLGAWIAGEWSARLARPLLWYAGVEVVVGLVGFLFHPVFDATSQVAFDRLLPALRDGSPVLVTSVKWLIAGALILPQSVLLGTTFPLMSAGVMRREPERPGRVLGVLYFANSLGASAGVLIAGFWLTARFGLAGTLRAAAVLNVIVGVTVALADVAAHPATMAGGATVDASRPARRPRSLARMLLIVAFGTAVASFIYEIAWIRMLALVLGSATHAFELMLSAFILGLALGSWWIRTRADRLSHPVAILGLTQWAMGVFAVATIPLYTASFGWSALLADVFRPSTEGYVVHGIARYAICLAVMLPATVCAGMTLPLITRLLLETGVGERAIGRVYSINTLGSILGVALAGLVLLPLLGVQAMLVAGASIDIALGAVLLLTGDPPLPRRSRRLVMIAAAATAGYLFTELSVMKLDRSLLVSGIFRYGSLPRAGQYRVPFYRDGRTATVSVRDEGPGTLLTLSTNGKPDASMDPVWTTRDRRQVLSLSSDMGTQILLPLLTLAHAPHARTAAVVGHGSGMSSHVLLASPSLRHLETIEIEPEMIAASRHFLPANRRVFEDGRSRFVIDDARAHLAAAGRRYDLIMSEPSNPWVSGVSGLFTREFYARVKRHLAPRGVFGQWLHLYEIDDDLVLSVLAAIDESFPTYDFYFAGRFDILIVASVDTALPPPDWSVTTLRGIRDDLRNVVPLSPEGLSRLRLGGAAAWRPLLQTVERPNSDYWPVLDLGAERARYLRTGADGFRSLDSERFDILAALEGRRVPFGTLTTPATPDVDRVAGLARGARLRAQATDQQGQSSIVVHDPVYDSTSYRLTQLRELARQDLSRPNWRLWLGDVVAVEAGIHLGTAGVGDERFYADVRAYAIAAGAPPGVLAALDFHEALAMWRWAEVVRAAARLREARRLGSVWVQPELLRDGAVTAAIRLGNRELARQLLRELTALAASNDDAFRLRTRLLGAHVNAMPSHRP